MAYTKTTWVNDQAPAINDTNLNKIETGIYDAHVTADSAVQTASNVGTYGKGVFKQKTGVNLEFKKIDQNSTKVSITDSADNVLIDVVPGNINHDSLAGLGDDDHTQYLLINGSRAMTGTLQMNYDAALRRVGNANELWIYGGETGAAQAGIGLCGRTHATTPGKVMFGGLDAAKTTWIEAAYIEGSSDTPKFVTNYGIKTDALAEKTTDAGITFTGILKVGSNGIKFTDNWLKQETTKLALRNPGDTAYQDLLLNTLFVQNDISIRRNGDANMLWIYGGESAYQAAIGLYGRTHASTPGRTEFDSINAAKTSALTAAYIEGATDTPRFVANYGIKTDTLEFPNTLLKEEITNLALRNPEDTAYQDLLLNTLLVQNDISIRRGGDSNSLWLYGGEGTNQAGIGVFGKNHASYPGETSFFSVNAAKTATLEAMLIEGVTDTPQVISFFGFKSNIFKLLERSSDPPEPAEGEGIIWMSDGTGKGDDGDILIASKAGGTTKWTTLFDHSAGSNW